MDYRLRRLEKELNDCKKRMVFMERRIDWIEEKIDAIKKESAYPDQPAFKPAEAAARDSIGEKPKEAPVQGAYGEKPAEASVQGVYGEKSAEATMQGAYGEKPVEASWGAYGERPAEASMQGAYGEKSAEAYGEKPIATATYTEQSSEVQEAAPFTEYRADDLRADDRKTSSGSAQTNNAWQVGQQRQERFGMEKDSTSAESVIGRKIMGIAASTLIFISLILFATLFIPKLGDTAKLILMFAFSGVFTAFGLYKLTKDEKSALYLSITGCGVGAVYISLFLSNIYFHFVGDVGLYLLLLVWVSGVLYLSRRHGKVFQVIGNIGILISVMSGMSLCITRNSPGRMIILIVYFIVGSMAFYLCHRENMAASCVNHAFQVISLLFLVIGEFQLDDEILHYVGTILLFAYLAGMLTMLLAYLDGKNMVPSAVFGILYSGELIMLELLAVQNDNPRAIFAFLILFVLFAAIEMKVYSMEGELEQSVPIAVWTIMLALMGMLVLTYDSVIADNLGFAVLAVPFVCYGFLRNRSVYKIIGLAASYFLLVNRDLPLIVQAGSFLVVLVVAFLFMNRPKGQYKTGLKLSFYLLLLLSIHAVIWQLNDEILHFDSEISTIVIFLVWSVINTCMARTKLGRNWDNGGEERSSHLLSSAVNALLMLYSLYKIAQVDAEWLHVIYILAALALFTVNVRSQVVKKNNFLQLYVAVKYTILLITVLSSYDAPNYVASILLFVLAIISIFVGFYIAVKMFRMYGLALSMICVFKLVMVDITYDNTLGHAFSFFISGILCFVISTIYYHAQRKIQGNDTEWAHQQETQTEPAGGRNLYTDASGEKETQTEPAGGRNLYTDMAGEKETHTEPAGERNLYTDPTGQPDIHAEQE